MSDNKKAVVVGAGAEVGVGGPVCRRLAREGLHVLVARRTQGKLDALLVQNIQGNGRTATAAVTDTTQEADVLRLFGTVESEGGVFWTV